MDSSIRAETSTGNGMGSLRWLAPELMSPIKYGLKTPTPNAETDVYALGCVFIEVSDNMLTVYAL